MSILLMGGSNVLYYPTAGAGIGAQRAYFRIGDGDIPQTRGINAFNIDFGDGETVSGVTSKDKYEIIRVILQPIRNHMTKMN